MNKARRIDKMAGNLMESRAWFLMECLYNAGVGVSAHDDVTLDDGVDLVMGV